MAKNYFHGDITSSATDWSVGDETTNNLPCSGDSVQRYIKSRLADIAEKPSYGDFTGSQLRFFSNEGDETPLFTIGLSTTIYTISITSNVENTFTVLSSSTEKMMTISASTQQGTIGSSSYVDFTENYNYIVYIDSGNGYMQRYSGSFEHGQEASFDIRPFLSFGDNRIKVTVTGQDSETTKSSIYIATVTSLTMNVNHTWNVAWISGNDYVINNIRFAGNVEKILHISVDGDEVVTETYSASTSYTTSSLSVTLDSQYFPSDGTGVYEVKVWLTSGTLELPGVTYNIMCVEAADASTAELVCLNNVATSAINFTTPEIFSYATYNTNSVALEIYIVDTNEGKGNTKIVDTVLLPEFTEVSYGYTIALDYDSEALENLKLSISATAMEEGNTSQVDIPIDNSHAYIATSGAWFQLKPALRDNSESNKTDFINVINGDSYPAIWTDFSYVKDGWARDDTGYSSLAVLAGSTISVKEEVTENNVTTYNTTLHLIPQLEISTITGYTLEFMIKSGYPSGYDNTILSISNGTEGLFVYPTEIRLRNSANDEASVIIAENSITHVMITWQRDYASTIDGQHNLCTIYINGINNATFSYNGNATWGYGTLELGQQHTDTYLYMIRSYNKALEKNDIKNNYLNAMIDGAEFIREEVAIKNGIVDGTDIKYDLVKSAGLNTMVVEMTNGQLPYVDYKTKGMSNVRFEFAQHPNWNTSITDAPIDGQGTTSMQYYRWNLRWKLAKAEGTKPASIWHYADGSTDTQKGSFDGKGNHPKVSKIVAKTNYASSMQGHKMGSCGLYNDLAAEIGLIGNPNGIPENSRAAIYQYPFFGFEYNSNDGSYTFIGLFTVGPDKGDKKTFRFDETEENDAFPSLLSLEGPNHAPLATRFLVPWLEDNSNVTYDKNEETYRFNIEGGASSNWQEAWDVAIAGDNETGKDATPEEVASIISLGASEWKPAYNFVFYHSPYIVPLSSTNYSSIANLNAAIATYRAGTSTIVLNGVTKTIRNDLTQIYDSSYNLYGFVGNQYVLLENLLNSSAPHYIGLTGSPSQTDIIAARGAHFATNLRDYFDVDWAIYHWCFCVLFALTDNFAKNTYPVKYKTLLSGGRWAWREDDMDTIFATDNNGNQTKSYSVEHGDTVEGVEIFQGGTSAFWVLVREFLQEDVSISQSIVQRGIKSMFKAMDAAFTSLAAEKGVGAEIDWKNAYNVVDYYFWKDAAKYFGINGYNYDREYKYIIPWIANAEAKYNGVAPLTQALGDQYQCEKEWVEKRLAYIYSMYRLNGMTRDTSGFGNAAFTLIQNFTFTVKPAINYYPTCSLGSADYPNTVTKVAKGQPFSFEVASDGTTTNYFHGLNYINDLGDLSGLKLGTRGGDAGTAIPFNISSDRLQTLTVGKESGEILFNASALSLTNCYSLDTLDARNVSSLNTQLNLKTCPRLRDVYLSGTNIPSVGIANGARIETLTLPATLQSLYLNNLPKLETLTLASWNGIRSVYMSNLQHLDQTGKFFEFIESVLYNKTQASPIVADAYYISWFDLLTENMTPEQFSTFGNFAQFVVDNPNDFGWVEYNNAGDTYNNRTGNIVISGHMDKGYINYRDIFSDLTYETAYIKFKDPVMHKICLDRYQSSATVNQVITSSKADADTAEAGISSSIIYTRYDVYDDSDNWVKTYLLENLLHSSIKSITTFATLYNNTYKTEGTSFDELQYFDNVTVLGGSTTTNGCFVGWTNLKSVKLPPKLTTLPYTFYRCSSLEEIELPDAVTSLGQSAFGECTSLHTVKIGSGLAAIGMYAFSADSALVNIHIKDIVQWIHMSVGSTHHPFSNQTNTLPKHLFLNGVELTNVIIPEGTTGSIVTCSFRRCNNITSISIPEGITSIGDSALEYTGITSLTLPNSLKTLGSGAANNCSNLTEITFGDCAVTCQTNSLSTGLSSVTTVRLGAVAITSSNGSFSGLNNIEHLYLSDLTAYLRTTVNNNANILTATTKSVHLYLNNEEITNLVIPNDVTSIPHFSFRKCTYITSVDCGNGVTSLGYAVFHLCSGLTTVNLRNAASIGDSAFHGCTNLTTLIIPQKITSSGGNTFTDCTKLSNIYITDVKNWCESNFGSLTMHHPFWKNNLAHHMFLNNEEITSLVIPSTTTTIHKCAFRYCTSITSATINNSMTVLQEYTFSNCTSLTSVTLPNTITTIGTSAFQECRNLTSINMPSSLTSIQKAAFQYCTSLKHIRIPDSVTTMGEYVLNNSGANGLESVVIGSGVTSIGQHFCSYNGNLKVVVVLPTSYPTIGAYVFHSSTSNLKIYVPAASESQYKGATNWTSWQSYIYGATFTIENGQIKVYVNGTLEVTLDNATGEIIE